MTDVEAELQGRAAQLRAALDRAGDRVPADVADRARADLDKVDRRLALGVDHAVVSLVGGTGSGKSSLFNAITRLDFADVGVLRPTTSQAAACVWGESAEPLLDFLEVARGRRIQHGSALSSGSDPGLDGLVLLDLPDHDSVAEGHASLVDRLLPMIDLLIWVLDPQKYADNVLHEKYLKELTDRHEAMLVVVNQVDTVPEHTQANIEADVRRLLAQDRLDDVPIILASAKTGRGVDEIRAHLARVVDTESVAAQTVRDELRAIARRVGVALAPEPAAPPVAASIAEELAVASGVPAVADSIRTAVAGAGSAALSAVQAPAASRIEAIREKWLESVAGAMPGPWRTAVGETLTTADPFHADVTQALQSVRLPAPVDTRARAIRWTGLALLVIGVIVGAVGALALRDSLVLMAVIGGVLVLGGLALLLVARSMRRRTAAERAQAFRDDVTAALSRVVELDLEKPTAAVLEDHNAVLGTLASVR